MLVVASIADTMRKLKLNELESRKVGSTNKQVKKDKKMGVFKIQRRSEQVGC